MHRGLWKSSSSPRIAGVQCSSTVGSTLWVMAPVVAVILGIVLDSISPDASRSGTGPVSPRVLEVEMLSTCGRGPETSTCHPDSRRWVRDLHVPSGLPHMGPGPPRALPDPRELSAQLVAREGSGAATCHADAGAARKPSAEISLTHPY